MTGKELASGTWARRRRLAFEPPNEELCVRWFEVLVQAGLSPKLQHLELLERDGQWGRREVILFAERGTVVLPVTYARSINPRTRQEDIDAWNTLAHDNWSVLTPTHHPLVSKRKRDSVLLNVRALLELGRTPLWRDVRLVDPM